MPNYQLSLYNTSSQPFTFLVYQTMPLPPNFLSLAWLCSPSPVYPQNIIPFDWQTNYAMYCGQTGPVQPGIEFTPASQIFADPQGANQTTFSAQPYPSLSPATPGQPSGSLIISTDGTVPPSSFAVSVGMSDSPSIITQANPYMNFVFPVSEITYWIAAVQPGQVNAGMILAPYMLSNGMQVEFSGGQYSASYSFDGNQWSLRNQ